jgi:hypothetical protein
VYPDTFLVCLFTKKGDDGLMEVNGYVLLGDMTIDTLEAIRVGMDYIPSSRRIGW